MWRHIDVQADWRKFGLVCSCCFSEVRWIWSLSVIFNDISVIYVTAHRCAVGLKKKLNLRSGSRRHRHFVRFFNVPVQAPTRDPPFYGYSEKPPHLRRLLRHAWGYGGHILDFTPWSPRGTCCLRHGSECRERYSIQNSRLAFIGRCIWSRFGGKPNQRKGGKKQLSDLLPEYSRGSNKKTKT